MHIGIDQLGVQLQRDDRARRASVIKAVRVTVKTNGERLVQEEVDKTQPHVPVDRGTYRRGFKAADLPDGAVLYNHALYAAVLEFGRRPGKFPPLRAIEEWVARKGFAVVGGSKAFGVTAFRRAAGYEQSKRALSCQDVVRGMAIKRIALAIARKLARQGMAGRFVLKRTEPRLTQAVKEAVDAIMRSPLPEAGSGHEVA
jgi:hypothetical protein